MMVVFNIDDFHSGKSIDRLIDNFGWTFLEHLQNLSMHKHKTPKTLSYQALYFTTMKLRLRIKKDFKFKLYKRSKLTRNKNARHIFPHHFFPVAMIGIICLHMHFLLYTGQILSS